jgi:acetyltransferase
MGETMIHPAIMEESDHFVLRNGRTVTIRPLKTTDAPHLITIFEHLSANSRYQRFNVVLDHPDPEYVAEQAEIIAQSVRDGRGFLAFDGEEPIGGVRYVRVADDSAEIALSFRDDYQGQGLGSHMLRMLVKAARSEGYSTLVGIAQDSNSGLWTLLERLDEHLTRFPDHGYSTFEIEL